MADNPNSSATMRLDLTSFGGLAVAAVAILGGLVLEGGKIGDVAQITAGIIVLGGTLGAVLVTTPRATLLGAVRRLKDIFYERHVSAEALIDEIISLATRARKQGLVSLEQDVANCEDPFLAKALSLAVDGADLQELRAMMELEIAQEEMRSEAEMKVFEAAGGYAPTIGIIGAVLGLIQVMKHLENIEQVGHGIAVAFVATVYGVALANLFCLPAAGKLRARANRTTQLRVLELEGVCSLIEGLNPKLIRSKLEAFSRSENGAGKPSQPSNPAALKQAAA